MSILKNLFSWICILFLYLTSCSVFAETVSPISNLTQNNCDINGIDYQNAIVFVKNLKSAVAMNSVSMIANMGDYPIRFNYHITKNNKDKLVYKNIKNKKEFINLYDQLFSNDIKNLILKQDPHDIFCNYQGAMIGNGVIWFRANKETGKFFAINSID